MKRSILFIVLLCMASTVTPGMPAQSAQDTTKKTSPAAAPQTSKKSTPAQTAAEEAARSSSEAQKIAQQAALASAEAQAAARKAEQEQAEKKVKEHVNHRETAVQKAETGSSAHMPAGANISAQNSADTSSQGNVHGADISAGNASTSRRDNAGTPSRSVAKIPAQGSGKLAVEVWYPLFGGAGRNDDGLNIRGRYSVNNRFALRLDLGYAHKSDRKVVGAGEVSAEVATARVNDFSIFPGLEYGFGNRERVSLHVGGALGFGLRRASATIENAGNQEGVVEEIEGATDDKGANRNFVSMGVNAFAGIDVYVYRGLYLGAELSIGFSSITYGKYKSGAVPHDEVTRSNRFGLHAVPSLRTGWRF
ncbi:MAG: hypothetical protein LBH06_00445 [Rikenellaceae bacterium]|nr:hypothetical protein [Rikenellaceae bacterium]